MMVLNSPNPKPKDMTPISGCNTIRIAAGVSRSEIFLLGDSSTFSTVKSKARGSRWRPCDSSDLEFRIGFFPEIVE
jgi:hypothetical protein